MRAFPLLALLLALALSPCLAGTGQVVAAAAPRMLSAAESEPWRAVGRVNVATADRTAMCTGTLISPDTVLTAAHCVIDRRSRLPFAPGNVHFVAGWRQGEMAAHRRAAAIAVHPGYLRPGPGEGRLDRDLALLRLDRAIDPETVPAFSVGLERPAQRLTLISYRRDRAHVLTRQDDCRVVDDRGSVFLLACDAKEGASGSPLFAGEGDAVRVVGVLSAMGRIRGQDVVLATEVGDVLTEMMDAFH